jgi:nicotinate-nucleotide adenylyltransferase
MTFNDFEPVEEKSPLEGIAPSRKPRLAVFGGSFDPIHNGHLFLAGEIIRRQLAEEVLFIPAARPPHKETQQLASGEDRLAMLKLALAPYPQFSCSDIELKRSDRPSYTIETLETLNAIYTDFELHFLMGMDSLANLHTWYKATELVGRHHVIVYPRPGISVPNASHLTGNFGPKHTRKLLDSIVDCDLIPISGTQVREYLKQGKTTAGLLPESVQAYVEKHCPYKN